MSAQPAAEFDAVQRWSLGRLANAGYTLRQARVLVRWRVDTAEAARLLERGCDPEVALRILRPLSAAPGLDSPTSPTPKEQPTS